MHWAYMKTMVTKLMMSKRPIRQYKNRSLGLFLAMMRSMRTATEILPQVVLAIEKGWETQFNFVAVFSWLSLR